MILYRDPFGVAPILEPVIVGMGYDFWGMECQTGVNTAQVRIYIDSKDGVTLDDCSRVSKQLSAVLDVEDPIDLPYTLEISSPGINRSLFKLEQLQAEIGSKVKVKTQWPLDGQRNFRGILLAVDTEGIEIKSGTDEVFVVPLDAIKNAKLDLEISFNE